MRLRDLNCSNVKSLEDIQPNGTKDTSTADTKMDAKFVACCQTTPNELETWINKHYLKYEEDENFYQAICEFCKNKHDKDFLNGLDGSTQWEKLHYHLAKKDFIKT